MMNAASMGCMLLLLLGSAIAYPIGGPRPLDTESERLPDVIDFYISTIQTEAGEKMTYEFVKVHSAKQQVVAGLNYYLHLEVNNNDVCEMHEIVVYDRFGDRSITSAVTTECYP